MERLLEQTSYAVAVLSTNDVGIFQNAKIKKIKKPFKKKKILNIALLYFFCQCSYNLKDKKGEKLYFEF